jgi:hypothetical protein
VTGVWKTSDSFDPTVCIYDLFDLFDLVWVTLNEMELVQKSNSIFLFKVNFEIT